MPQKTSTSTTKQGANPKTTCYHCGDDCKQDTVIYDEKSFCCNGCSLVYQVINNAGLDDYYNIESKPGINALGKSENSFDFLDNPEVAGKIIEFQNDEIIKLAFSIPQIHCASCVWLLEKLHDLHDSVLQSKVDFLKKELYLTISAKAGSVKDIALLLQKLGYQPAFNFQSLEEESKKETSAHTKAFYYKIGVAGFCFGNIMLLSFPEYLGISSDSIFFQKLFGWVSLFLSLPILFYAANDYLKSAYNALAHKGINIDVPISLGIIALFGRSAYEIISSTGAGYLDSLAALIFFLLLGKWFQQQTFENISFERDYKSYFPIAVRVISPDQEIFEKPLSKLAAGDIIEIKNQEIIPGDALLLSSKALIDYSFVTGESDPVEVKEGELVYAGGRQVGGIIRLTLRKEVSQSYLTRLWNSDTFTKEHKGLDSITDTFSKYFTFTILAIAFGAGAYWWFIDTAKAMHAFTSVLIIACPCALALNVPFALGNSIRVLARNGFYLRNTNIVEILTKVSEIVFDKTGTVTSAHDKSVLFEGDDLSSYELSQAKELAKHSNHPISKSIFKFINIDHNDSTVLHDFEEYVGKGISGMVNGTSVRIGNAKFVGAKVADKDVNKSISYLEIDGEIKGKFIIRHKLRDGIWGLMASLKEQHFATSLLSGDNDADKVNLGKVFGADSPLHFNQSPHDKLEYIKEKQAHSGACVMMVGDGLNDAGALKQSDIGVAVSEDVNLFTPSCDIIIHSDKLSFLSHLIRYAKVSLSIVKIGFVISLLYNVVGLSFAVQGTLSPVIAAILMPVSSITVVVFGYVFTSICGKRLFN